MSTSKLSLTGDFGQKNCRQKPLKITKMVKNCQIGSHQLNHATSVSPARKVDKKVANRLLKVAQKVATLRNRFKTNLMLVLTGF